MEFRSRSNQPRISRPAQQATRPGFEETKSTGASTPSADTSPRPAKRTWLIVAAGIVVLIILGGLGMFVKAMLFDAQKDVRGDKYQALFLTNGQVYFGHLSQIDSRYAKLTNIYYLQVQQAAQPTEKKDDKEPQVSLTKLGGELHGPEDAMYISRDQILFWENLKDDGKVAQAIKEYQKK